MGQVEVFGDAVGESLAERIGKVHVAGVNVGSVRIGVGRVGGRRISRGGSGGLSARMITAFLPVLPGLCGFSPHLLRDFAVGVGMAGAVLFAGCEGGGRRRVEGDGEQSQGRERNGANQVIGVKH